MTETSTQIQNPDFTSHENDELGFWKFMVAGSIAGMVEHMEMFPVDTLKTRMQMIGAATSSSPGAAAASFSSHHHHQIGRFFISIMRKEGPLGLYRGIAAMGLGGGPAHAVYFSVYETCKRKLGGNEPGHHPLVHAVSGVVATIASDTVLTPMDVVKQRLQLKMSPYIGVKDCVLRMFKEEGFKVFYTSYRTTIVMNAPFTVVHFATYEAMKKVLGDISPDVASEERMMVHITAGGAAGALAGAVTTPLDVVNTRLQSQVLVKTIGSIVLILFSNIFGFGYQLFELNKISLGKLAICVRKMIWKLSIYVSAKMILKFKLNQYYASVLQPPFD